MTDIISTIQALIGLSALSQNAVIAWATSATGLITIGGSILAIMLLKQYIGKAILIFAVLLIGLGVAMYFGVI